MACVLVHTYTLVYQYIPLCTYYHCVSNCMYGYSTYQAVYMCEYVSVSTVTVYYCTLFYNVSLKGSNYNVKVASVNVAPVHMYIAISSFPWVESFIL